jgi:hypothetical protein
MIYTHTHTHTHTHSMAWQPGLTVMAEFGDHRFTRRPPKLVDKLSVYRAIDDPFSF